MPKLFRLLLIDQGSVIKNLALDAGTYVIGRSDQVDMVINSKDVSREHACIEFDGSEFQLKDLKSTNGTFLNGKKINTSAIKPGDEIMIGDYILMIDDGSVNTHSLDATEAGRKGDDTVIIEDHFQALRQKIDDKELKKEFSKIEMTVKKSRQRLSSLAKYDQLTGLYNRQHFNSFSKQSFEKSVAHRQPFSVLFIDIDHFKKVNDNYGHKKGDDVLRMVAQLIKISCRKSDYVARYGGEEIIVILPDTDADGAIKVGGDINSIIKTQSAELTKIPVTVSIGVASYPEHGDDLKIIIEKADKALYHAKESGRNRVIKYHGK